MKFVIEAKILPVRKDQLREGDEILWSNIRCVITNIIATDVFFVFKEEYDKGYKIPSAGDYRYWYRIVDCKEIDCCISCGRELPKDREIENQHCEKCEKEFSEGVQPEETG
jgi:hypothetical protein